jgi:hypothetical protein
MGVCGSEAQWHALFPAAALTKFPHRRASGGVSSCFPQVEQDI